ncbi:MAG: aminotransferase class I/II-fold pyridoxal phosphate-dependent enzyme [Chitinispirillia bacterium]|nr:aminotransferase class I/II-fold pyridoxal phosphate-dependent enzyme [Chitinispirillia bacterium]MCL2242416.1 aminotransferase class I/II-fold pyridoxal phosphate-dependent enzyme [Chitinispirillia bacterium]
MLDPEAAELNETIKCANPYVYVMLSERGKRAFFPTKGILAQTAEAKGKAINATIGTALEDCGKTMELPSVGAQISFEGDDVFSYAPNLGKPEIRNAWKKMMLRKNPSLKDGASISTPVVTAALTHGLSAAGYLFINRGDTIVTPDLFWENYNLVFNYSYGSALSTFPMFNGRGGFNTEALRQKLVDGTPGKKIVILNFPNNPTGYTVTEEEAAITKDIIVESAEKGNNLVVFIDDAYFGLVFENGILRESMFAALSSAHERILAVKVDGPTKEDYVWGMRIGFVTFGCKQGGPGFYRAMESKLGGSIRGSVSSVSNIGQTMLLRAYENKSYEQEKNEKFDILRRRYTKIREILEERKEYAKRFKPLPFNSGYFMCLEVISGKAEEVRRILLDKYDTGVIALGNLLRVAFSSTPYGLLEKLFDNIYKAAGEA